jgi:hypothetical protein
VIMMWEFEHTITTAAKVDSIWRLYSDITTWTTWGHGIENAILLGDFQKGTKGQLQPRGKDTLEFEITNVEVNQGFSDRTNIPGAGLIIYFDHELQSTDDGTTIKHRVTIGGANAKVLGAQFGEHFKHGIPVTMAALAQMALKLE